MNKSTLISLTVVAIALIGLLFLSVSNNNHKLKKGRTERIGKPILTELIEYSNNQHPAINASLKGKTVIINVWASWCQPCLREIPELNQLVADFGDREEIVFIALDALDEDQEKEKMERFDIQFDYQLYFEQEPLIDLLYSYKLPLEKRALPLNILIDQDGQIRFYYTSYKPEKIAEMRTYLESL